MVILKKPQLFIFLSYCEDKGDLNTIYPLRHGKWWMCLRSVSSSLAVMVWNLCSNPQSITCSVPHLIWHLTSCHGLETLLTKTGPSSSEIPFTHCISNLVSCKFMLFFNLWTLVLFPSMAGSLEGFGRTQCWVYTSEHTWGAREGEENRNIVVISGLVSHKEQLQQGWGRHCKYPKVLYPGLVLFLILLCLSLAHVSTSLKLPCKSKPQEELIPLSMFPAWGQLHQTWSVKYISF